VIGEIATRGDVPDPDLVPIRSAGGRRVGEETTILEALKQGARGYIVKGDETDLGKAIRAVQRGEVWAKRRVLARLMEELIGLTTPTPPSTADEPSRP